MTRPGSPRTPKAYTPPGGRKPRRVALRNQERLRALLSTQRSTDAIVHLSNEGRALTDDQACQLTFPLLATDA